MKTQETGLQIQPEIDTATRRRLVETHIVIDIMNKDSDSFDFLEGFLIVTVSAFQTVIRF